MFDQVFEASYLQPIVLVQISHFIHKAVLITLTRQFNNILVIFFKSTRMISLTHHFHSYPTKPVNKCEMWRNE